MLLDLAAYGKNVSAACEYVGVSRYTYYRIKKAYDEDGVEALARKSRKVQNLKNRVPEKMERAVLKLSLMGSNLLLTYPLFKEKSTEDLTSLCSITS